MEDEFLLSDVYYAGGTVSRDVTSQDVATEMMKKSNRILYFPKRNDMVKHLAASANPGDVILIMGARDTTLSDFAKEIVEALKSVLL